jgi:hypothetical protein
MNRLLILMDRLLEFLDQIPHILIVSGLTHIHFVELIKGIPTAKVYGLYVK